MTKWYVQFVPILGQVLIKEDDDVMCPVAEIATPRGNNWVDVPHQKARALRNANLIATAPLMLHALEVAQFAISLEDKEAYDIVQEAIKQAKEGNV